MHRAGQLARLDENVPRCLLVEHHEPVAVRMHLEAPGREVHLGAHAEALAAGADQVSGFAQAAQQRLEVALAARGHLEQVLDVAQAHGVRALCAQQDEHFVAQRVGSWVACGRGYHLAAKMSGRRARPVGACAGVRAGADNRARARREGRAHHRRLQRHRRGRRVRARALAPRQGSPPAAAALVLPLPSPQPAGDARRLRRALRQAGRPGRAAIRSWGSRWSGRSARRPTRSSRARSAPPPARGRSRSSPPTNRCCAPSRAAARRASAARSFSPRSPGSFVDEPAAEKPEASSPAEVAEWLDLFGDGR